MISLQLMAMIEITQTANMPAIKAIEFLVNLEWESNDFGAIY